MPLPKHFIDDHPNSGERTFSGYLRSIGINAQRARVRESMSRVEVCPGLTPEVLLPTGAASIMCACPIACSILMVITDTDSSNGT